MSSPVRQQLVREALFDQWWDWAEEAAELERIWRLREHTLDPEGTLADRLDFDDGPEPDPDIGLLDLVRWVLWGHEP